MSADKIYLSKNAQRELTKTRQERIRQLIAQKPLIRTKEMAIIMGLTDFVVTNAMRSIRDEFIPVKLPSTGHGVYKGFILNPDYVHVPRVDDPLAFKKSPHGKMVFVDQLMMDKYGTAALAQPLRKLSHPGVGSTLDGGYW
jgi:hypothetical protein